MNDTTQVEALEPKKSKRGRPSRKSLEATNVEAPEAVQENVEAVDVVQENTESILNEVPLEFVENTQENVEYSDTKELDITQSSSPVMEAIEEMIQTAKKVLKRVPDNFDIIRWRRQGRR